MDLSGWIPVRLVGEDVVEWVYTGELRFVEPFFQQTLEHALRDPFSLLFRVCTPVETLLDWQQTSPGVEPSGFIFHLSRCGSTLVTQMLAASPRLRVLSEPGPVDSALRGRKARDERVRLLRALLSALGQLSPGEEKVVLKLDSWSVLDLDTVAAAYPDVPWIFLYRDPLEVLVSQLRHAGIHTVPGALPPQLFGLDASAPASLPREEYVSYVLGRICEAALSHAGRTNGLFAEYVRLPEFVVNELSDHFGLSVTDEERGRMLDAARRDAKNPVLLFERDSETKRVAASPEARRLVRTVLEPLYQRLRAC